MSNTVFICEKPSQATDIAKVIGNSYRQNGYFDTKEGVITWVFGHVLALAEPDFYTSDSVPLNGNGRKRWRLEDLPIIPEKWKIEPIESAKAQLNIVGKLLKTATNVVISTDADREGELIGRELLEYFNYQGSIQRLWLSALDPASIKKALARIKPGKETWTLYQASMARQKCDWLVGMNLSRYYSLKSKDLGFPDRTVLTVGRVQTPTLALVVRRDLEIEDFKPSDFCTVQALVKVQAGEFKAKWIAGESVARDEDGRVIDKAKATAVANFAISKPAIIDSVETQRKRQAPPLPYDLPTLQREASSKLNISVENVLKIAQKLYETYKITSYPRTDCRYLPLEQLNDKDRILDAAVRNLRMANSILSGCTKTKPSCFNDSKITAHHAIIPLAIGFDLGKLDKNEKAIYEMIAVRYIAQFWPDYEYDQTNVELTAIKEIFRAVGRVEVILGWKTIESGEDEKPIKKKGAEDDDEDGNAKLPPMQNGEQGIIKNATMTSKKTKPPPSYTQASLLLAMETIAKFVEDPVLKAKLKETAGIGTSATRAAILERLLKLELIDQKGKKLISTDKGRHLIKVLPRSVTSPEITALWEQAMDEIVSGERTLQSFLDKQIEMIQKQIK